MNGSIKSSKGGTGEARRSEIITLPNLLSLSRILLTPVFVVMMIQRRPWAAFFIFLAAGATDALDGFTARWLRLKSTVGLWLDPPGDKILLPATVTTPTLPVLQPRGPVAGSPGLALRPRGRAHGRLLGPVRLHRRPHPPRRPRRRGRLTRRRVFVFVFSVCRDKIPLTYSHEESPHESQRSLRQAGRQDRTVPRRDGRPPDAPLRHPGDRSVERRRGRGEESRLPHRLPEGH